MAKVVFSGTPVYLASWEIEILKARNQDIFIFEDQKCSSEPKYLNCKQYFSDALAFLAVIIVTDGHAETDSPKLYTCHS